MISSPVRVLFLNHVSDLGGAEASLLDLIQALDRSRCLPLAAIPGPGRLHDRLQALSVPTVYLPFLRLRKTFSPLQLGRYFANVRAVAPVLRDLIDEEDVDIVHANSNTAHLYAAAAASRLSVPIIWHCRDLVRLGPLGYWLAFHASRVVAISHSVERHLQRYRAGQGKTVALHNGVDPVAFRPRGARAAIRRELGLGPDVPVIAMAGQFIPWKSHILFLDAVSHLAPLFPEARFLIIGDVSLQEHRAYRERVMARAEQPPLTGRVLFTGYKPNMAPVLDAIDVLVHPASREPLGRIILEAMAMEKPVVAVNACGPAEIIHDGVSGVLVRPRQAAEMAAAVIGLLREPEYALRMGKAARLRVETDFHPHRLAAGIQRLYHDLVPLPDHGARPAAGD